MTDFSAYIKELQSVPLNELTEHSKRFALETVLRTIAESCAKDGAKKIHVLHEPKRKENYGAPDFKIFSQNGLIGYVENKKITENLDKILTSEQIKKYRELSDNLLITNYLEFIWIKNGTVQRETLCKISELENIKFKHDTEKAKNIENLIKNFYSQGQTGISDAQELARALAIRAKNLKVFLHDELVRQQNFNEKDYLIGLYEIFRSNVFNELSVAEFSDAFAQMLVYGLFLAKLNADTKEITLDNAKKFIPKSFELIRELVGFLEQLENKNYRETKWIIDEVISVMNHLDLPELKKTLTFSKKVKDSEDIETDPYIYFYETFLAAYDSDLRKSKGVYYTPPQVVSFIIASVNQVLKNIFHIEAGIASQDSVTILDFATGTGTFLTEILKQIFESPLAQNKAVKTQIIKEHILKNIYGFEYLIAPYTIAHLKLSQFLRENGYELSEDDRFQLFLTNTLEPIADIPSNVFVPHLSSEGKAAQKIKDKPILVITGNPPYSGHSKNKGQWISNLLRGVDIWAKEKIEFQANYYQVDSKPLGEKNSKWLQDDYVKFIRFAQHKIDKTGAGIVAVITNHSFLDNPTFRGMRESLMKSFDQLYFIDLHGNAKKKEKTPEGTRDQNVFDIEQGTAISVLIKKQGLKKQVFHTDFWGLRKHKFDLCLNNSIDSISFEEIKPNSPFYLFKPQNQTQLKQYNEFWKITDIFEKYSLGVFTHRDSFLIDFNKNTLFKRIKEFSFLTEKVAAKEKFGLSDTRDWKIEDALKQLKKEEINIQKIAYRPFDKREICYNQCLYDRGTSRFEIMSSFWDKKTNIALNTSRIIQRQGSFCDVLVSDCITDAHFCTGGNYVFPLFRYNGNNNSSANYLFNEEGKRDNFTEKFRHFIQTKYSEIAAIPDKKQVQKEIKLLKNIQKTAEITIKSLQKLEKTTFNEALLNAEEAKAEEIKTQIELKEKILSEESAPEQLFVPTPEQIFGYIYSVLHSSHYREKYAEFLKMDFPRIPFCENAAQFQTLSETGLQLTNLHLQNVNLTDLGFADLGNFNGEGDNIVLKHEHKIVLTEAGEIHRLFINPTQYFENVPQNVFEYCIGGYFVLEKYLKDRKNKQLELSEISNLTASIRAIAGTLFLIEKIDAETKSMFE